MKVLAATPPASLNEANTGCAADPAAQPVIRCQGESFSIALPSPDQAQADSARLAHLQAPDPGDLSVKTDRLRIASLADLERLPDLRRLDAPVGVQWTQANGAVCNYTVRWDVEASRAVARRVDSVSWVQRIVEFFTHRKVFGVSHARQIERHLNDHADLVQAECAHVETLEQAEFLVHRIGGMAPPVRAYALLAFLEGFVEARLRDLDEAHLRESFLSKGWSGGLVKAIFEVVAQVPASQRRDLVKLAAGELFKALWERHLRGSDIQRAVDWCLLTGGLEWIPDAIREDARDALAEGIQRFNQAIASQQAAPQPPEDDQPVSNSCVPGPQPDDIPVRHEGAQATAFDDLPADMVGAIASFLDDSSLANFAQTGLRHDAISQPMLGARKEEAAHREADARASRARIQRRQTWEPRFANDWFQLRT